MDIENLENEIQSWVAVRSFAVEDANPQLPIIDANELAEMLKTVFKKLEGCVLVPAEPTDAMLFAASGRDIVAEHYGDENIMWPELRETWKAMLEAARGGK